jgi:hypothetical protein
MIDFILAKRDKLTFRKMNKYGVIFLLYKPHPLPLPPKIDAHSFKGIQIVFGMLIKRKLTKAYSWVNK